MEWLMFPYTLLCAKQRQPSVDWWGAGSAGGHQDVPEAEKEMDAGRVAKGIVHGSQSLWWSAQCLRGRWTRREMDPQLT